MLLEVFKKIRLSRSKICKSLLCYTKKGFFTSQNFHFYSYKLHNVCFINRFFKVLIYLLDSFIVFIIHKILQLGDKGYFYQLCDQFMTRRNYDKTFECF